MRAFAAATSLSFSVIMPLSGSAAGCASATAGVMPNASVTERTAAVTLVSGLSFLKSFFFILFLSFSLALSATSFSPKKENRDGLLPSRPVFPWRNPPLTCGFAPCLVGLLTCAFESVQAYAHACLLSRRALRLPRLPQWPAFAFEVPGSALTAAGAVQEFHLIPLSIFAGTR